MSTCDADSSPSLSSVRSTIKKAGTAFLAVSFLACVAFQLLVFVGSPRYLSQNIIERYNTYWTYVWSFRVLSVLICATAIPALLCLLGKPIRRVIAVTCLIVGLAAGGLSWPRQPSFSTPMSTLVPYPASSARAKVVRAKGDMRTIGTAVEAYAVDLNQYPPWTLEEKKRLAPFYSESPLPTFAMLEDRRWVSVRRPVLESLKYRVLFKDIGRMPRDLFCRRGSILAYWAPENIGWIMLSRGPDGVFDLDFETLQKVYDPYKSNPRPELFKYVYDSTNGGVSAGDIVSVMGSGIVDR